MSAANAMIRTILLSIGMTLLAAMHVSALAQAEGDPYEELADISEDEFGTRFLVEQSILVLRQELTADPAFRQSEKDSPGFIEDYLSEMRAPLARSFIRARAIERELIIELYRNELTEDEARKVVALFRTGVFQRLLDSLVESSSQEFLDADLDLKSDAPSTEEETEALQRRVATRAAEAMSEQERQNLVEIVSANPVLLKMMELQPRLRAITVKVDNLPSTAEEDAVLAAAADRALDRHFPEDF